MKHVKVNCPSCNSDDVAEILYGPVDRASYQEELESRHVYIEGGMIREEGPHWLCNECKTAWCRKSDDLYYLDELGDFIPKEP